MGDEASSEYLEVGRLYVMYRPKVQLWKGGTTRDLSIKVHSRKTKGAQSKMFVRRDKLCRCGRLALQYMHIFNCRLEKPKRRVWTMYNASICCSAHVCSPFHAALPFTGMHPQVIGSCNLFYVFVTVANHMQREKVVPGRAASRG